jgi:subtilisin family serine protease
LRLTKIFSQKLWSLKRWIGSALLLTVVSAAPAPAQTRLIVRDSLGLPGINATCLLLGCRVINTIGDPQGQVFVITTPSLLNPLLSPLQETLNFINLLLHQVGIVDVEIDQTVLTQGASAGPPPDSLMNKTPVSYYGTTVWQGYVAQPAYTIIGAGTAHSAYGVTGSNVIVAVIDTGVDTTNPVLTRVLTSGYDFTRNSAGGDEKADVNQSTVAVLDQAQAAQVNQSTVAVLDQSTVAVLDNQQYAAFGHGTMVSGIVHLVAPQAKIMPLKAFNADGSGYISDIMRATYYAAKNGATVLNMSFSYPNSSPEMAKAINYAVKLGAVPVASAGNDGQKELVYPGALSNVIDVASTNNQDVISFFSNYGAPPVWVAAPGEGVVTTYPWGAYASGWGTSFSTPLVSGTVALLQEVHPCNAAQAASAVGHAQWISPDMGQGRLDTYQAVQAWRASLQSE